MGRLINLGFHMQMLEERIKTAVGSIPQEAAGLDPHGRLKVLQAAAVHFSRTGLHGTSVSMLASSAGIRESILYARFGNKERLFREVVENSMDARLQLLEARTRSAHYETETIAQPISAETRSARWSLCGTGRSRNASGIRRRAESFPFDSCLMLSAPLSPAASGSPRFGTIRLVRLRWHRASWRGSDRQRRHSCRGEPVSGTRPRTGLSLP